MSLSTLRLVLLDLLKLDADPFRELLLGHPHHPAAVADPFPDVNINRMRHGTLLGTNFTLTAQQVACQVGGA